MHILGVLNFRWFLAFCLLAVNEDKKLRIGFIFPLCSTLFIEVETVFEDSVAPKHPNSMSSATADSPEALTAVVTSLASINHRINLNAGE